MAEGPYGSFAARIAGSMVNALKFIRYAWAGPATLIGLTCALAALPGGGRRRVVDGVLEAWGRLITRLLQRHLPVIGSASAMTFGHVIIGEDPVTLDLVRGHEQVHVRQYERWGPLFIPSYLLASMWIWIRGGHPYYDNPFEREARERE